MVCEMDLVDIVSVIAAAMVLAIVVGIVRIAWRTFHDNEEMVSGGSWGEQMLAARKRKRARRKRKSRVG